MTYPCLVFLSFLLHHTTKMLFRLILISVLFIYFFHKTCDITPSPLKKNQTVQRKSLDMGRHFAQWLLQQTRSMRVVVVFPLAVSAVPIFPEFLGEREKKKKQQQNKTKPTDVQSNFSG